MSSTGGNSDLTDLINDGEEKNAVWLPRSQIEIAPAPGTGGGKGHGAGNTP